MRILIALAVASCALAQMPSELKLKLGETHQFTAPTCPTGHSCEWRIGAGHDGTSSLTVGGLYTAPTVYHEHGKIGGCPLTPHNSPFAIRINNLSPVANSAAMIATATSFASVGIRPGIPSAGPNLVPPGTAEIPLTTYPGYDFTAANGVSPGNWNGNYPFITPPFLNPASGGAPGTVGTRSDPRSRIQSGWRSSFSDNRWTGINPSTCEVYEYYWHDSGVNAPFLGVEGSYATVGGVLRDELVPTRYQPMSFKNAMSLVGSRKSSNASGIWNSPMQLDPEELARVADRDGESGNLGHMFGITLGNAAIRWINDNVRKWPAISWAGGSAPGNVDHIPYGARIRIKQSFIDTFPFDTAATRYAGVGGATRVKAMLHVIFNTWRDYGLTVMDGTSSFDSGGFHTRSNRSLDPDAYAAMDVMRVMHLNFNWANPWLHAEIVDVQAAYMVREDSLVIRHTDAEPEYIQYFDTTAGAAVATTDVIVTPPTVGSLTGQYNIVAGADPVDIGAEAWATGLADNTALTWTATPFGVGSLSGGVYTPPSTVAQPTTVTVRVAATAYPAAYTDIRVVIYPPIGTGLYVRSFCGRANTDANIVETTPVARTWWGKDSAGKQINPFAVGAGPMLVHPVDTVYPSAAYGCGGHGEMSTQFYVPNGRYKVTSLLTNWTTGVSGNRSQVAINGQIVEPIFSAWDKYPTANSSFHMTHTPVDVTDGSLVYNIGAVGPAGDYYPQLSAIVIEPAPSDVAPPKKGGGHGHGHASGTVRMR